MAKQKGTLRTCPKGHQFYKSSTCPVCPVCAAENKPTDGFLSELAAPARRALHSAGLVTLKSLSKMTEAEVAALHGMGPSATKVIRKWLKAEGLSFK